MLQAVLPSLVPDLVPWFVFLGVNKSPEFCVRVTLEVTVILLSAFEYELDWLFVLLRCGHVCSRLGKSVALEGFLMLVGGMKRTGTRNDT